MAQMPIIDLSSGTPQTVGSIDWSKPDELPPGTYRCDRGWNDTSGAEWGCLAEYAKSQNQATDTGTGIPERIGAYGGRISALVWFGLLDVWSRIRRER